jgi:hypothetical protein
LCLDSSTVVRRASFSDDATYASEILAPNSKQGFIYNLKSDINIRYWRDAVTDFINFYTCVRLLFQTKEKPGTEILRSGDLVSAKHSSRSHIAGSNHLLSWLSIMYLLIRLLRISGSA